MKVKFFRKQAKKMLLPLQTQGWLDDTINRFWVQPSHKVYFLCRKYTGKIMFQSDVINDRKRLLLF